MYTILIRPNASEQYQALNKIRACEPPLWLCLMANLYNKVEIIDAELYNLSDNDVLNKINNINYDKIIILPTGSHPSAFIQQLDSANKLKNYLINHNIQNIIIYKYLPFNPLKVGKVRWDLVDIIKYRCHNWQSMTNRDNNNTYGVVFTSISCYYHCDFCAIHNWYKMPYAIRDVDSVIYDIKSLYDKGIKNFKIMDELFLNKSKRTYKILERLTDIGNKVNIWCYARIDTIDNNLLKQCYKAGIKWISYGIESGNDNIRQKATKGNFTKEQIKDTIKMTKDNNISIIANYMFGFWDDNYDTMQETLDLAIDLNTEFVNFYCVIAYPNTILYNQLRALGINIDREPIELAQTSKYFKPLPTKYLSEKDVLRFRDRAFIEYFDRADYLNMINNKFGNHGLDIINNMLKIKIKRKILDEN